jgi:hypothetical protein
MPASEERIARARSRADRAVDYVSQAHRRSANAGPSEPDAAVTSMLSRSRAVAEQARVGAEAARQLAVLMEEEVAAAHESAAVLYERWMREQWTRNREDLARRANAHRERARDWLSPQRLAHRIVAAFEARALRGATRAGKKRQLAALEALVALKAQVVHRIDELVADSRREGASWAEIADMLHVTRQTAHQRYRQPRP